MITKLRALSVVADVADTARDASRAVRAAQTTQQAAQVADEIAGAAHPLAGMTPAEVVQMAARRGLQTPQDSLILWSGLGPEGPSIARSYAESLGGVTLEMTPGGAWLDGMDLYGEASPFTRVEADMIWGRTSSEMVGQARGQVRSVLGQVRPDSAYRTYELPALYNNPAITGIDEFQIQPRIRARN